MWGAAQADPQALSIGGVAVERLEYRGEPVVTFAMIDELHERAEGTSKRNFSQNRSRFTTDVDYFTVTGSEIRTQSMRTVFPPRTPKGILLTRRGYLKITKSLTDDRSWDVQAQLIDAYFAHRELVASGSSRNLPTTLAGSALTPEELTNQLSTIDKNVAGSRAGLFGYLSKTVMSKITDIYDDVRRIVRAIPDIKRVADALAADPRQKLYVRSEWMHVTDMLAKLHPHGPIPRRGFLSTAIQRSLMSYAIGSGRNASVRIEVIAGNRLYLWEKTLLRDWYSQRGKHIIDEHLLRYPSRGVL